ncbi:MAG: FAD-dependent oxidoreductase [Verrucomicrobiota bacterium]|nr:FAD-dependent oxidoreductase [Verrucomicrobiota bacterium]
MKYDAIIIGGGLSGLAAGIRLAYYNKKVCIIEKHSLLGGLNSYYYQKGHYFDVGLHAMTNYIKDTRSARKTPLAKLLRQLRIPLGDLYLAPQKFSRIAFPNVSLDFTNDSDSLIQQISDKFPASVDDFLKLKKKVDSYNELDLTAKPLSARKIVSEIIKDSLLIEMIFCPLMYYGSAEENDMEFGQFCIMFKSIFEQGFCRPEKGMKAIIKLLEKKYLECNGELIKNCGVRKINTSNNTAESVELSDGRIFKTEKILSSAGYLETLKLLDNSPPKKNDYSSGQLSFVETIFMLDKNKVDKAFATAPSITFYNSINKFHYCKPDTFVGMQSGVICLPHCFNYEKESENPMIRITNIADCTKWVNYNKEDYLKNKNTTKKAQKKILNNYLPNFENQIIFEDMFTPKTIIKYTGHINGAVYGMPQKKKDGTTPVKNLYICGTDQGFLGIVGSMLSGISMANYHIMM